MPTTFRILPRILPLDLMRFAVIAGGKSQPEDRIIIDLWQLENGDVRHSPAHSGVIQHGYAV